jgi:hypothetical protein
MGFHKVFIMDNTSPGLAYDRVMAAVDPFVKLGLVEIEHMSSFHAISQFDYCRQKVTEG